MPVETDADRADVLSALASITSDDVYARVRGQSFHAVFNSGYDDALGMVESTDPFILCRTSDVTVNKIVKGDVVTIGDEQYRVDTHEPDGTGMSRVQLRR